MAVLGSTDYLKKLSLAALLVITACAPSAPTTETEAPHRAEAPPAPSVEAPPIKDLTFFDDIVTPEAVFPDPKARALFEAMPPETTEKGDERLYSFMLASRSSIKTKRYFRFQQPGMKTKRSLYFISVTVAPAGAFPLGGMGFAVSGGSLDSSVISTPDGIYDFRIMIGSLLPKTIKEPKFDFDATKEQLSLRYSQKLNNSLEGK